LLFLSVSLSLTYFLSISHSHTHTFSLSLSHSHIHHFSFSFSPSLSLSLFHNIYPSKRATVVGVDCRSFSFLKVGTGTISGTLEQFRLGEGSSSVLGRKN
jgi:hypothetical protein